MTYIIEEECTASTVPVERWWPYRDHGEIRYTACRNCATMLDDSARELPREHVAEWSD